MNEQILSYDEYIEKYFELWKNSLTKDIIMTGDSTLSLNAGRDYYCNDYETTSLSVTPEGFLSSCPEASLQSDPLADFLMLGKINSSGEIEFYRERIEKLKSRNPGNISECRDCFVETVCNGGCVVKILRKEGEILGIDSDKCNYFRNISFRMLNTYLNEPESISTRLNPASYNYSDYRNPDYSLNYIAFNPEQ